jgi:hypothetical protein
MLQSEVEYVLQEGNIQSSGWKMRVSARFELSPSDRKFRSSATSGSILQQEVNAWYVIDHGAPPLCYIPYCTVTDYHEGISISSDRKVEHFNQGEINPLA